MAVSRERRVLRDLERQLRQDDPEWVRAFSVAWWQRREVWLDAGIGVALVLAAVAVLLGVPEAVVVLGTFALVLTCFRLHPPPRGEDLRNRTHTS